MDFQLVVGKVTENDNDDVGHSTVFSMLELRLTNR